MPKFDAVHTAFERGLNEPQMANGSRSKGCTCRAVELADKAGVVMTPTAAAFLYGDGPKDSP